MKKITLPRDCSSSRSTFPYKIRVNIYHGIDRDRSKRYYRLKFGYKTSEIFLLSMKIILSLHTIVECTWCIAKGNNGPENENETKMEHDQISNFIKLLRWRLWLFHRGCDAIRFAPKSNFILRRKRACREWKIFNAVYDSASSHFMRISARVFLHYGWYLTVIIPAELRGEIWPYRNDTHGATYRESEYTSDLLNANLLRDITLVRDTDSYTQSSLLSAISINISGTFAEFMAGAVRGISKVRFPTARYISVFPAHEKWICRLARGSLNFPELIISRNIQTRKEPRARLLVRRDARIDSIKGVYGNRLLRRISIGVLCGPRYVRRIRYSDEQYQDRESILFH